MTRKREAMVDEKRESAGLLRDEGQTSLRSEEEMKTKESEKGGRRERTASERRTARERLPAS